MVRNITPYSVQLYLVVYYVMLSTVCFNHHIVYNRRKNGVISNNAKEDFLRPTCTGWRELNSAPSDVICK